MTPRELEIVATTALVVDNHRVRFAAAFYEHVFRDEPEVRLLFPDDMGAQQAKLVDEVVFLAEVASDLDGFVERARALGERHHGYGVRVHHYDVVHRALIAALGEVLGDGCTADVRAAWSRLYLLVSETMLEGATGQAFS